MEKIFRQKYQKSGSECYNLELTEKSYQDIPLLMVKSMMDGRSLFIHWNEGKDYIKHGRHIIKKLLRNASLEFGLIAFVIMQNNFKGSKSTQDFQDLIITTSCGDIVNTPSGELILEVDQKQLDLMLKLSMEKFNKNYFKMFNL